MCEKPITPSTFATGKTAVDKVNCSKPDTSSSTTSRFIQGRSLLLAIALDTARSSLKMRIRRSIIALIQVRNHSNVMNLAAMKNFPTL